MPNAQEHLDYLARVAHLARQRYYIHSLWDLYDMASLDWEQQHARVIPVGVASALYRACLVLWTETHGLTRTDKAA